METFILGTSLKFTTVLNVETAASALITIEDSTKLNKVTDGVMTKSSDNVYIYNWQSTENDNSGIYVVTFKVGFGGMTSVREEKFEMIDSYDTTD